MKQQVLKIHKDDNVLVALTNLSKGASIVYENQTYQLVEDINAKHKFFIHDMRKIKIEKLLKEWYWDC